MIVREDSFSSQACMLVFVQQCVAVKKGDAKDDLEIGCCDSAIEGGTDLLSAII